MTEIDQTELDKLVKISQPARRALRGAGITTLEQLAERSEKELLGLHGLGPKSMPELSAVLTAKGMSFKS
ncbi:DNA-directed RNA polymerase subunit alpha C-terminal domain-containing protein [Paenibacillus gorillae]|uniref:DNA-directed RNA polymerase subunit alpha C-terminal domain-containing protein n=1 Tax=Paenibacillus gorillae TaxID=1243662 RepID=UPI0004AE19D8|nr:DNA-directed RNA polymerase subunit alpha C-terminal domain-containing protein [Paenibacillus gorillae]